MGHGARTFLAGREIFLNLQNFGALQMPDFGGNAFNRRPDHTKGCKKRGMTVARNNLC